MKINGIWSKVGEQKMKFSIVLAKKWVGNCPPSSDAPVQVTKIALPLFLGLFIFILALSKKEIQSTKPRFEINRAMFMTNKTKEGSPRSNCN